MIYFVLNCSPPVPIHSLTEPKLRASFVWRPEYKIYQQLLSDAGNKATNAPFDKVEMSGMECKYLYTNIIGQGKLAKNECHHGSQTGRAGDKNVQLSFCRPLCVRVYLWLCRFVILCLAVPALVLWNSVVWKDLKTRAFLHPLYIYIHNACLMWFSVFMFISCGNGLRKVQRERESHVAVRRSHVCKWHIYINM